MRKDKFKDFEPVPKELDLVEEEDQFTHLVTLDDATDGQDILSKSDLESGVSNNNDFIVSLKS